MKLATKIFNELKLINANISRVERRLLNLEREVLSDKLIVLEQERIGQYGSRKDAYTITKQMRSNGSSYKEIIDYIQENLGIKLSNSTISDWVKGKHKP